MKIAITADLHLKDQQTTPERYRAFRQCLDWVKAQSLTHLVLAGDVFDSQFRNYRDFDDLCSDRRYSDLKILILPGNHDATLTHGSLTANNVTVIEKPELFRPDLMSLPMLILPYTDGKTMGEMIEPFASELPAQSWVLFSHGDWISGIQKPNPLEPGVYMPLTRADVATYQPRQVILGHIHQSMDEGNVHYPGSLLPLDINETGKRRILILDSETGHVESQPVASEVINMNASITVLPVADEAAMIVKQIDSLFKAYGLDESQKSRLQIRLKVSGYSKDKRALADCIQSKLAGLKFYQNEGPDLSDVFLANDSDREEIARRVMTQIASLHWPKQNFEPNVHQIVIEALHVIYGGA